MSIDYDVIQRVKFNKESDYHNEIITNFVAEQLAFIAYCMLRKRASIYTLEAVLDGKQYSYSGKILTGDYGKIIDAIQDCKEGEVLINYYYAWGAPEGGVCDGPFPLAMFLSSLDDENLADVDYSLYYYDYSEGGDRGHLLIYGKRGDRILSGEQALEVVTELPEDEQWRSIQNYILLEDVDYPKVNREAIKEVAMKLLAMSRHKEYENREDEEFFSIDDETLYLEVRYPELNSPEEVHQYARLACELKSLLIHPETGEEADDAFVALEFISETHGVPKLLSIDVNPNGNYVMKILSDKI